MPVIGATFAFWRACAWLAWFDRAALARPTRGLDRRRSACAGRQPGHYARWRAIQLAGGPVPTLIGGTLPVVIAITANLLDRHHGGGEDSAPWIRLATPLALILGGLFGWCIRRARAHCPPTPPRLPAGHRLRAVRARLLDLVSDPQQPLAARGARLSRAWATAQRLATLPVAIVAGIGYWLWDTRLRARRQASPGRSGRA